MPKEEHYMAEDRKYLESRVAELEETLDWVAGPLGLALHHLSGDPGSSLNKAREALELLADELLLRKLGIKPGRKWKLAGKIENSKLIEFLPDRVRWHMNNTRALGNLGSHPHERTDTDALIALYSLCEVLAWYIDAVHDREAQQQQEVTSSPQGAATAEGAAQTEQAAQDIASHQQLPKLAPVGHQMPCPGCDNVFYTEVRDGVAACPCGETVTMGPDGKPVGLYATCAHCGTEFYTEDAGKTLHCPACEMEFLSDEDGDPAGVDASCPLCEHVFYTEDAGKVLTCPSCSTEYRSRNDGEAIGAVMKCPGCDVLTYVEGHPGEFDCDNCGIDFNVDAQGEVKEVATTCPFCGYFHANGPGPGKVECKNERCDQPFHIDAHGTVLKAELECPYCGEDVQSYDLDCHIYCSECEKDFPVDDEGNLVGWSVSCPFCGEQWYSERDHGQLDCDCGTVFRYARRDGDR